MSDSDTITVEPKLLRTVAAKLRYLLRDYPDDKQTAGIVADLETSLAAHDGAATPLGLPWKLDDSDGDGCGWALWTRGDEGPDLLSRNVNEAQARLMAAAPDLADAAERALASMHAGYGEQVAAVNACGAALKKAGRP